MSLSFCVQKIERTDVGFTFSEFNEFRHRIARSIGLKDAYPMSQTDMYLNNSYKEMIDYDHPMYPLIDHADNDGKMESYNCGKVGEYLKTIILEWEKELCVKAMDGIDDNDLADDIIEGKKLAKLMIRCYENDETLLFV